MAKNLFLDFESFSELDLSEVGLDLYSRHESTGVHMLAWAIGDGKIKLWIPKNPRSLDGIPAELLEALIDPANILIAHNAQFERVIFERILNLKLDIPRWRDVMVCARSFSLPGKLGSICEILKLSKDDAKADGDELIKFFSMPSPKRKKKVETLFGTVGRFNEPERFPDKWKLFCDYCIQDVHCERVLWKRFEAISPILQDEWENWFLDQRMNELGMPVNRKMAENGLWLAQESKRRLKEKLVEITGLENPLSDKQMKEWLSTRGYEWGTLLADYVKMELANAQSKLTKEARAALRIRQEANKRSYTKLEKILLMLGPDDQLRYQFAFGAAARTFRWAGVGVQPQNLLRPIKQVKKNYQKIIDLICARDYDTIEKDYPSVIGAVSSSVRMLFQAAPDEIMAISDLNAIENRGVGYLARCPAILEVFALNRCPYLSFATNLYPMTYEELEAEYQLFEETKGEQGDDQKRQNAKPPVLGGAYGLGIGEMIKTEFGDEVWGGLMGYARKVCGIEMPLETAQKAIPALRKAWPEVVQYWKDLEEGFKHVFKNGGKLRIGEVTYRKYDGRWQWVPVENVVAGAVLEMDRRKIKDGGYMVRIKLPSGRYLHYLNVALVEETVAGKDGKPWTREQITYDGIEHSATTGEDGARQKKKLSWGRVKTYGGKLCLAGNTRVLTDHGIKFLINVNLDDRLWDGFEWVRHEGTVCNGKKETHTWTGLTTTYDHQILAGREWRELGKITNRSGACSLLTGLVSGLRLLSSLSPEKWDVLDLYAIAEPFSKSILGLCEEIKYRGALPVDVRRPNHDEVKGQDTTSFPIPKSEGFGLEKETILSLDAIIQNAKHIRIMGAEGSNYMSHGDGIRDFGWRTPSPFQVGMTQILNSIGSTMTEIMNPEISDLFLEQKIQIIGEVLSSFLTTTKNFPMKSFVDNMFPNGLKTLFTTILNEDGPLNGVSKDIETLWVYDIVNAGPRHRFTVLTDMGPVIVHNCENVVQAFCRDLLVYGMRQAEELGFSIFGCFHDEIAATVKKEEYGLGIADLRWCMIQPPPWSPDMPLGAEGIESKFYRKG